MEIKDIPKCDCGNEAYVTVTPDNKFVITHCGVMAKGDTYAEAYKLWAEGIVVPYEVTMDDLVNMFDVAKENELDIAVMIRVPEVTKPEIVVTSNVDLDAKLQYYKDKFDVNLCNKENSWIKIVDFVAIEPDMFDIDATEDDVAIKGDVCFPSNNLTFGDALEALKNGFKLSREGWNGKEQYIELATCISYKTLSNEEVNPEHQDIGNAAIAFVGTRGRQLGWLASQSDMLASDWRIVD